MHFFVVTMLGLAPPTSTTSASASSRSCADCRCSPAVQRRPTSCCVERAVDGFRPLRPQFCSIYDPYFWWHERYWKLCRRHLSARLFNGTPFKNLIWRLLGVRIGSRVFDDGCCHRPSGPWSPSVTTARSTPAAPSSATPRRTAPSSPTASRIGAGCTLGVGAFVHYGVTMGDGAVLAADSFLMKGEEVPRARTGAGTRPDDAGALPT